MVKLDQNFSPLAEVWQILIKPDNRKPDANLQKKLEDMGLSECSQLEYLLENEVEELKAMLKTLPGREFTSKLETAKNDL